MYPTIFHDIKTNNDDCKSDYDLLIMRDIIGPIKPQKCNHLEELKTEQIIDVKGIKQLEYRGKLTHVLKLRNIPGLYLSKYWLNQEMINKATDITFKFTIKTDAVKITPLNKIERQVEIIS